MFVYKHFVDHRETSDVDDVIRNLTVVLKTKRGCGYFLQSFGLSDVGYRTPEEMVTALTTELEENIRLYEPRVRLVDIDEDYDDDGERARLVVTLQMRDGDERLQLVTNLANSTFDIRRVPSGSESGKRH